MSEKDYIQDTDTSAQGSSEKKDDDGFEKVCYMCRRPESKAGPMISMPGGMNLCHSCMQKAFDSVTQNGIDLSKLPNMPYMNMNFSDMNMAPPAMEIPKKQKIKKKTEPQPALTMKDIPGTPCDQRKTGRICDRTGKSQKGHIGSCVQPL